MNLLCFLCFVSCWLGHLVDGREITNLLFPFNFGELLVETSGGWWEINEPVVSP